MMNNTLADLEMRSEIPNYPFKQPHLAESDWNLGLGEAAHLLHIELSVCNR